MSWQQIFSFSVQHLTLYAASIVNSAENKWLCSEYREQDDFPQQQ